MDKIEGIVWDINPILLQLGQWEVRWYGLLFALGFVSGIIIMTRMFQKEGVNKDLVDSLFLFVVIGTVLGARLGHVFFYDWAFYQNNPGEIIKIWHGGLASHGGFIGIVLALYIWSKKYSKRSVLWIFDRVVVPSALAGTFIRLGNLMNSEIIGKPADIPWAFTFVSHDMAPRHPSQLYESLAYLGIFALLMFLYWKTNAGNKPGRLFGLFMSLIFGFRILIEFTKENQVAFEDNMTMNMGQWLSIPLVLVGLYFIFRKVEEKTYPRMDEEIKGKTPKSKSKSKSRNKKQ
ncbi:MAG: prolipoprotein diacylglyceryl transferase [Bacteroidales bacterium]|nr:prolipoprotein diacylglyceryl transferase [Bacteroidales bacterium]